MNLTSEPHPLLSPGIKCRNPLQLLVPYLVPHLDMQATTSKAETTLRNSLLASAALLTHSLPGGVALGSVCFTQRLSMNFCRAGWRQTKRASRAFQGTPPSSSSRPSLSPSRFALLRLACRVRSGLASMGLCRLPTRRRPQWDAPSSCCLADLKPLLP